MKISNMKREFKSNKALMLKLLITCAVVCVVCSFVNIYAQAAEVNANGECLIVSGWAQDEVSRALQMGLLPSGLWDDFSTIAPTKVTDYRKPITRAQFVRVAMDYVACMQSTDTDLLRRLCESYTAETNDIGSAKVVFRDDATQDTQLAYYLGIVKGYEDGTFKPDGLITRQEAACFLSRAYQVCGGTLPAEQESLLFADRDSIASWAAEDIAAMVEWNVLKGVGDGLYDPTGHYTIEQCLITFLRLYESAPVSPVNDNVTRLYTREQAIGSALPDNGICVEGFRLEGQSVTFLRQDSSGVMLATSQFFLIDSEGGIRRVKPVAQNESWGFTPNLLLEDVHFSQDGQTLFYTITIPKDVISYMYMDHPEGVMLCKKGVYYAAVDVKTAKSTYVFDEG